MNEDLRVEHIRRSLLSAAAQLIDRHNLNPLPIVQIVLSLVEGEDRLVQNPGWFK